MKTLPEWPDRDAFAATVAATSRGLHPAFQIVATDLAYQTSLAAAWEARCRLAVEALVKVSAYNNGLEIGEHDVMSGEYADKALSAIGPLPEETK